MTDNSSMIYVDGIYKCASTYNNPCNVTMSAATSVVSVRILNGRSKVGLVAAISYGGCTSNNGWKCTTNLYTKWYELLYDDSFWSAAKDYDSNAAASSYGYNSNFANGCLWTSVTPNNYVGYIYCRKWFV